VKKTYNNTLMSSPCSICLTEVRSTRSNTRLRCGHIFHTECLDKWKEKGKNTCPTCRKLFDVSKFTVTITVTNNDTGNSDSVPVPESEAMLRFLDECDINFDIENVLDLRSLLSDLGMSLSDFNSGVADTE
jgi:hypothetical protein